MKEKRSLAITATAVFLVSLAGCGAEGGDSAYDPTAPIGRGAQALSTDGQVCLSVQRGAAGEAPDATLWASSPRWTNGANTRLSTGTSATGGLRRSVVLHDLSAVPAGATVLSASLSVYQLYRATGGTSVDLYRVTAPWSESSVTWSSFNDAFAPEPLGSFTTLTTTAGWRTVSVVDLAQAWVDHTLPNHGILLDEVSAEYTEYRSSESPSASQRPRLDLCYVTCDDGIQNGAETGVDCGGPGCASCSVAPEGTSVLVQVLDAAGAPLVGAAVTLDGSAHATDGAGRVVLDGLAAGRFSARVETYGFAPASVVLELSAGVHTGAEARLLPLGEPIPFAAEEGAVIAQGDVRVAIPPGALVDANGEPVTGPVEATVVPFDPTTQDLARLPGPLEGTTAVGGEVVGLDSVMMAEVSLWQGGNPLQLAPGATATLELPLPDAAAAGVALGDTIPAWWFDLDAGLWREEGAGTIQPSSGDPGRLAWVVEVHHFTWWNCDRPWTEKRCFQVTVVDPNGAPLSGQIVGAVGTSYNGLSTPSTTNAAGQACVEIMNGGAAQAYLGSYAAPFGPPVPLSGVGPASACGGQGAACATLTVMGPATVVCTPGSFLPCAYSGPPGTAGVGLCQAGKDYCDATGTGWLGCAGEVLPSAESCTTPFDDDCDGLVNEEGQNCACTPGSTAVCYTGPAGTAGVGLCAMGERTCDGNGMGYGPCVGQVLPQPENCAGVEDENCDGSAACNGVTVWAKRVGDGGNYAYATQSAADAAGNVVVRGIFDGPVDFGDGPLTSTFNSSFVVKLDAAGNHRWSRGFGGVRINMAAMSLDGAGNVVLTGQCVGTVDFGGGPLTSTGGSGICVVNLDAAGNHRWSRNFDDSRGFTLVRSVAADGAGNVVLTGDFSGSVDFGGGPLTSTGDGANVFVAKLDAAGNHLWSRHFGSTGGVDAARRSGVVVDGAGNVVLTGFFNGTVDFGGDPLTSASASGWDIFVAKLDAAGNHLWSRDFGNIDWAEVYGAAVDGAGNVVLMGGFEGTVDFGGGPLTSTAYAPNVFVVKLDAAGNHLWSRNFVGHFDLPSMAMDGAGNVVLTGGFWGTVDFGGGPLTSGGWFDGSDSERPDAFVAKLGSAGNHLWSRRLGGNSGSVGIDVGVDGAGNVVLTGRFGGTVDFGSGPLTSTARSFFVAKLTP